MSKRSGEVHFSFRQRRAHPARGGDVTRAFGLVCIAISCVGIGFTGSIAEGTIDPLTAVYVANKEGSVSAFTMSRATGALTAVLDSPYPSGTSPQWIAVDPTNTFVYVTNCGSDTCDRAGSVFVYAIDQATGGLSISSARFTDGRGSIFMSIDPSGRFAYVANHGSNTISAFSICGSGALTPIPGSPFPAGPFPASVAVDPNGQFVYVANCASLFCAEVPSGSVSVFRMDATSGGLTPVARSPFAVAQRPIAAVPDVTGQFLYVADSVSPGRVHGLSVDPDTGALSPVAGSPWPADFFPRSIMVDPSNRFVYVANIGSTTVSAYTIDVATGALQPISGSPFSGGRGPDAVAVDGSSQYAYVANFNSANLSGYRIDDATGSFTPLVPSVFPTGVTPTGVVVVNISPR